MFRSEQLFERAVKVMPGGVNSPVRAYQSVGSTPRFIRRADGAYVYDVDQNRYIDYICSWGPMILGHNNMKIREAVIQASYEGLSFGAATEMEVNMAERICRLVPSMEMVRMVNSGTEAVMSAIRAARGYTGRNKIIKFEGCYHGHSDSLLVKAGSGVMTAGIPDSLGVPEGCARDTLTAVYNNCDSVARLFEENKGEVAALIVEPVAGNMGVVEPCPGFLQGLRDLCTERGAVLIFDEVITGFRLSLQGAQGYYGITPDLTTFGKIIGGGMPVGAYCGSRALMEQVAPCGPVYQAGTLSGNPVAMAAGLAQLRHIRSHPELYVSIEHSAKELAAEMRAAAAAHGTDVSINQIGSLIAPFFTPNGVTTFVDAKGSDVGRYARYFRGMLERGIYLAPAQFEAMFISTAHTKEDFQRTLEAVDAVFAAL